MIITGVRPKLVNHTWKHPKYLNLRGNRRCFCSVFTVPLVKHFLCHHVNCYPHYCMCFQAIGTNQFAIRTLALDYTDVLDKTP